MHTSSGSAALAAHCCWAVTINPFPVCNHMLTCMSGFRKTMASRCTAERGIAAQAN